MNDKGDRVQGIIQMVSDSPGSRSKVAGGAAPIHVKINKAHSALETASEFLVNAAV